VATPLHHTTLGPDNQQTETKDMAINIMMGEKILTIIKTIIVIMTSTIIMITMGIISKPAISS